MTVVERELLPVGGQRLKSGAMPSKAIKAASPAARESMSLTLHCQPLLISLRTTEILLGLTHTPAEDQFTHTHTHVHKHAHLQQDIELINKHTHNCNKSLNRHSCLQYTV